MSLFITAALSMMLAAPTPAEVDKAVDSIIDSDYQRKLPGDVDRGDGGEASAGSGKSGKPWWRPDKRRPGHSGRDHDLTREQRQRGPLSAIATALMWVLIVVAIALIALLMIQEFVGYNPDAEIGDDGAQPVTSKDADAAVVARPLGDAEALAQAGDFAEAIHVLLLRTLEELSRRGGVQLPPSLTSREILGRIPLPGDAQHALADLVTAVEVSHFGGATPGASDYHLCRDRFQLFAAAYTRGRA